MNEREIACEDLNAGIDDLRRQGFRVDLIYPADDPGTAVLSNGSEKVRLSSRASPAPSGALPQFAPQFVLTRSGTSAGQGRAGMLYRDLIPTRLGGRYIASHISIPDGGPVRDWVHFHRIAVQMIYVRRGWVRVAYQDQGDPFVMREGDLVIQPPEIRHRVLESSDGLEVVEITAPALHATFADHELVLPNGSEPGRLYGDQHFLRHVATDTPWTPFAGAAAQETGVAQATHGIADVRTVRAPEGESIDFPAHDGELAFGFVLDGSASLHVGEDHELSAADAFVIPPGEAWTISGASPDFRLLHMTTATLD